MKETIEYNWDGGTMVLETKDPILDLSYISPNSSCGVFDQDFSHLVLDGCDMSYSNFTRCDFSNCSLLNVCIRNTIFDNCVFKESTMSGITANNKTVFENECDLTGAMIKKNHHNKLETVLNNSDSIW